MHKNSFQIGELLDVQIEKLTFGGNGLARVQLDGQNVVVFVPYSAPGDQLKVKVSEIHKNYYIAEIHEILISSSSRTTPQCQSYGLCGGCNWQHLQYSEQLKQKENIVREQIEKTGAKDFRFLPIIPSPMPTHYRNKVQLKFENNVLGFYARKTHTVVTSENCILMEEPLFSRHLQLATDLKEKKEPVNKIELSLTEEGFSQVNRFVNELLQNELMSWLEDYTFQYFFDFYAGSGNFTFPIFKKNKKATFTAVELSHLSVQNAKNQIKKMNLPPAQLKFYQSDVEVFLKRNLIPSDSLILLDPPRAGCSDYVIRSIEKSKARAIFYISCDPSSLSRDLKKLIETSSWKIKRVRSFDMFPQTHHVETLVELTR